MQAVIEYKTGDIDTLVDTFETVDEILREHAGVKSIWFVMDEFGEQWDPDAEPVWSADGEDVSVYISRKTDGSLARLDMRVRGDERKDIWFAIDRHFPGAFDLMDEHDLLGVDEVGQYDSEIDRIFDDGEDAELCEWLGEWSAEAVELDGGRERLLGEACGHATREDAIEAAKRSADEWINRQPCDLAELVVMVKVGDDEVLRYQDAEWEVSE